MQSRREAGSFPADSDDDSMSDGEGTQVQKKGNYVTMTRIVRAGGTKGPRIKQVSRHAATVFSRATKEGDEEAKGSRSDQESSSPDRPSGRQRSGHSASQSSEKLSDEGENSDFDTNEFVSFTGSQDTGRSRIVSRRKGCGRCDACKRRKDCGACTNCR